MDIRMAGVVVCVAVFFLTVVLIVQYQQNRQYRGLGLAATAQAVMLAAFGLSMLPVPIWLQVIGVPATVVSLLILYAGLQQFLGEPVSSRWLIAYTGVSVVVIAHFSLIAPDLRWRRFCTYLLVADCLAGLFWMLGRHRHSRVPHPPGQPRRHRLVGRLGGDEFGVLLPWLDTRWAARWVQALLDASTNCPFSAGLAIHGDTVDELMAEADRALYRAKHGGRHQVVPG